MTHWLGAMDSLLTYRSDDSPGRAYDLAMRRAVGLLLATMTMAACTGSSSGEPEPLETPVPVTAAPTAAPTTTEATESTVEDTVEETIQETTTSEAPTTTIDEAAILAEAEAAFFDAWQVGTDAIRNPDDPENENEIRDHFTQNNLDLALENLRLAVDGNFIAVENLDNPSFAQTYDDIEFVGDTRTEVSLTVCEFYSERIFERGVTPDGSDNLVRDNPVTKIIRVGLVLEDGSWKSATGVTAEEVRDEVERCTTAS